MIPDMSIRINNLIKSLEKTIIPAIDPENGMAMEQSALMIGHLKMLDVQWDNAYLYEMGSFENMKSLVLALIHLPTQNQHDSCSTTELSSFLDTLPAEPPLTVQGINSLTIALGHKVDQFINSGFESGSEPLKQAITETVLDYTAKQSSRERVWFRSNNLDPDPSDLVTMDEMLFTDVYRFTPTRSN